MNVLGCNLWGFGASSMTPQKSFGLNGGQYGEILGSWQEELYHELMIRDFIFKGNTPKTVTFDVGEYVCSFVRGMGS